MVLMTLATLRQLKELRKAEIDVFALEPSERTILEG